MRKVILIALIVLGVGAYVYPFGSMDRYSNEELVKRMYSPSVPVAVQAIREIGLRRYKPAIPDLIEFCYADVRQIRTAAMFSLGIMGAENAIEDLNYIVWDDSKMFTVWDRISATLALGQIPKTDVRDLIDILNYHPNNKVALAALKALEKRPEPAAKIAIKPYENYLKQMP